MRRRRTHTGDAAFAGGAAAPGSGSFAQVRGRPPHAAPAGWGLQCSGGSDAPHAVLLPGVRSARLGAALMRFQVGDREQALLEVEDEQAAVGIGNARVHAALAVMLHALRPRQQLRAEGEWEAAVELAPKFEREARTRELPRRRSACARRQRARRGARRGAGGDPALAGVGASGGGVAARDAGRAARLPEPVLGSRVLGWVLTSAARATAGK